MWVSPFLSKNLWGFSEENSLILQESVVMCKNHGKLGNFENVVLKKIRLNCTGKKRLEHTHGCGLRRQ